MFIIVMIMYIKNHLCFKKIPLQGLFKTNAENQLECHCKRGKLLSKIRCSECEIQRFPRDFIWRDFVGETKLDWTKRMID